MVSAKGFLKRDSSGRFRMTATQKKAARFSALAVIYNLLDLGLIKPDVASLAKRVVSEGFDTYDTDRSCETCDFFHGSTCREWNAEVPEEAIDEGCDQHKTDGVPF